MTALSILAALVLFLVLTLWRSTSTKSGPPYEGLFLGESDASCEGSCPRDKDFSRLLVGRIFSNDDDAYLAGLGSSELTRVLRAERRRIAIRWIRSNATEARVIVHDHVREARSAADVQILGEVRLGLRYLELLLLCAALTVLVSAVGPSGLRVLAGYADGVMGGLRLVGKPGGESAQGAIGDQAGL